MRVLFAEEPGDLVENPSRLAYVTAGSVNFRETHGG
jgi:hypothetical protein